MIPLIPTPLKEPAQQFLLLLERWNKTHALTALPPKLRMEELIRDSCALLPYLPEGPGRIVDFGTGMGIPAMVLAAVRPDLEVVALDKSKKKVAFVRQVQLELKLPNLRPTWGRAEEVEPLQADLATAKAVGDLDLLTGWWARHGRPGAPLLALKSTVGPAPLSPAGWSLEVLPYTLPTRGDRCILRLRRG